MFNNSNARAPCFDLDHTWEHNLILPNNYMNSVTYNYVPSYYTGTHSVYNSDCFSEYMHETFYYDNAGLFSYPSHYIAVPIYYYCAYPYYVNYNQPATEATDRNANSLNQPISSENVKSNTVSQSEYLKILSVNVCGLKSKTICPDFLEVLNNYIV